MESLAMSRVECVDDIISYDVVAAEDRERSPRRLGEACPARHAEASAGGSSSKGRLAERIFIQIGMRFRSHHKRLTMHDWRPLK